MICARMSVAPEAIWYGGTVMARHGFINAIFGRLNSVDRPYFRRVSFCMITQLSDDSLPAADMVNTAPNGMVSRTFALPEKKSQKSPSYRLPCAIAFAESIAEPPPTARMKSIRSRRTRSMPSYTLSSRGFGIAPPRRTHVMPCCARSRSSRSISPERTAEPPP